ncbi:MAG: metallophosphoesterase [Methylococcaceae bacterium]|jgi:hypothetical protein
MHKNLTTTVLVAAGLIGCTSTFADSDFDKDKHPGRTQVSTLAVYGDSPYGCKTSECPAGLSSDKPDGPNPSDPRQIEASPEFINAINHDPKIDLVMHVGDIHSGSQYCTLSYNRTIASLWSNFKDPLVYTPGDNEWTDCHKSGEGGNIQDSTGNFVNYANGDPVANLALIRAMFFPKTGETLGEHKQKVISQAIAYDTSFPKDAEYVENVMWEQSGVLFVTVNIPGGSNNDDDKWYGADKTNTQIQEAAQRTAADLRWLDAAFTKAQSQGYQAVVIAEQADMWDLDGKAASHIANYQAFIDSIAAHTIAFGKPVLLINGDSHVYRSDNPLTDNAPCFTEAGGCSDDAYDSQAQNRSNLGKPPFDVSNFHRLVVHGSTFPLEYLRLTINPRAKNDDSDSAFGPFNWERVQP